MFTRLTPVATYIAFQSG